MEKLQKLILLAEEANGHYIKFLTNNNLKAAVRCRKALSELRKTALETRLNILDKQKVIGLDRYAKSQK
ncbi:hypothetical protein EV200_102269 [Pedobacter psychrotolerans]|uniref:Uncharacterized protein n=1 Tax=Pedobacter psychrotolerans TaxID=1843235 RepID=A0A4R2HI54_9SPHI|nr:hypothetical protein [Pedobacter psychrotolerans]TCO28852.1 hypothetical protein EV200_102269 [Pedobacter psychrotolerans]GGE52293.1 hypothetical protein GCM10011413_18240 [Pedobacter psychrotolerans]